MATQSDKTTYNLLIHKDINSLPNASTQWFYFQVKNQQNVGKYTFNLINYMKAYSTFLPSLGGMKISIFS